MSHFIFVRIHMSWRAAIAEKSQNPQRNKHREKVNEKLENIFHFTIIHKQFCTK